MADKATQIAALLAPTVEALGLELIGVEYLPAPGSWFRHGTGRSCTRRNIGDTGKWAVGAHFLFLPF
jgi:ribosome maturation factor RimP